MDQLKSTGQASRRGFRRRKLNDDAGGLLGTRNEAILQLEEVQQQISSGYPRELYKLISRRFSAVQPMFGSPTEYKVKIERLKDVLQMLRDNERKSKLRNQHLLQDFEKVGEHCDDLDSKARKLKRVKEDYENYIKLAYPHWKENIEVSEMNKTKVPFKELELKKDRGISSRHIGLKSPPQKQRVKDAILSPIFSSSRAEDDLQLGSMQYEKPNQYLSPDGLSRSSYQMNDEVLHLDQPMPGRREALNSVHVLHHDEQNTFRSDIDRNRNLCSSQVPVFDPSGRLLTTGYTHIMHTPRLSPLNSQRKEEGADISSFKILPQALALSPNGQLVLLPMTFSPQMGLLKDHKNGTEVFDMNSKLRDLDGSSRGQQSFIDITGKYLQSDVDKCSKYPENTLTQVTDGVAETMSMLESEQFSASSKIEQKELCYSEVQEFSEQPIGNFDECKVDLTELGREEEVVGNMGTLPKEYESSSKPAINRQEALPDDITLHRHLSSRSYLSLKSESDSVNADQDSGRMYSQISNVEEVDGKGVSNNVLLETSYDKLNSKAEESFPAPFTLKDCQKENAKEGIRLADDVDVTNDFQLECEHKSDSVDLDDGISNLNQMNGKLRNGETMAPANVDIKGKESPDLPKGQFSHDGSLRVQDAEDFRPNVEAKNLNSNILQSLDSNSAARLDSNGLISKVEEYHSGGDKKGVSNNKEQYSEKSVEQKVAKVEVSEKKERVVDIPEISYLFEEIENRMDDMSHNEFYCTPVEETSDDTLKKVKKALLQQGSLDEFATSDLSTFSRLSVTDFVGRNSKTGCIVQVDKDLSKVYTLNAFREAILSDFEELWEYVFNHMELLASSHIFENPTVCELFSNILCPGNSTIAFEVSQAVLRIMDGVDDSIRYEDDQEYSSVESNSDREMANSQPYVEAGHGILSTKMQEVSETTPAISSARTFEEHAVSNDGSTKESFRAANTDVLRNNGSPEKNKLSKEKKEDIATLSVSQSGLDGDVDDNSSDDDDDESTFDSEKLVPHGNMTSNEPSNVKTNDRSNCSSNDESNFEEEIISEMSSKQISKALSKKDEKDDDTANESGDDLEDMLSASLVLDSARQKKDGIGHKKPLSLFEQRHDSFDTDEVKARHEIAKTPQKHDILSPQHSRSISSKFRKPGFWENSDTESEADHIDTSVEKKLDNQNASEDEFDFDFYN